MAPPALVCYTAEKSYKKAKLVAPIFLKHRRGAELSVRGEVGWWWWWMNHNVSENKELHLLFISFYCSDCLHTCSMSSAVLVLAAGLGQVDGRGLWRAGKSKNIFKHSKNICNIFGKIIEIHIKIFLMIIILTCWWSRWSRWWAWRSRSCPRAPRPAPGWRGWSGAGRWGGYVLPAPPPPPPPTPTARTRAAATLCLDSPGPKHTVTRVRH